jgi:hypothetical protein
MTDDPKLLVARGYDCIAEVYLERYARSQVRDRWLEELVALLRVGPIDDSREDWLGTQMFFSHYGAQENEQLIRDAGFSIERAEVVDQDNEQARFLWVIASQRFAAMLSGLRVSGYAAPAQVEPLPVMV